MIKIELDVTTKQLVAIAAVLADGEHILSPGATMSVGDITEKKPGVYSVTQQVDSVAPRVDVSTDVNTNQMTTTPSVHADSNEGQATGSTGAAFAAETTVEADTSPSSDVQLAKSTTGEMIPWDARIHGAAKKINADGSWKLLKGVDRDNLVPQVEAELMGLMVGNPIEIPESVSEDTPPPPSSLFNDNTPPPPPPGPKVINTFPELLPLVTGAKAAGTLTDERINQSIAEIGLTKFGELAVRTDLVPRFAELAGLSNG